MRYGRSIVVEHLSMMGDSSSGLAFIYCKRGQQGEQSLGNLLSSLISQLVRQTAVTSGTITKSYEDHTESGTRPSAKEYENLLRAEATRFNKVFIVIDAIDECNSQARLELLGILNRNPQVSLLVTSQPGDLIKWDLQDMRRLEVKAKDEDISTYIEENIQHRVNIRNIIRPHPDLVEKIKSVLTLKADGM